MCGCSLFDLHSLGKNSIGDRGAQHIGEGLKKNRALTKLKCGPLLHHPNSEALDLLLAGLTAVIAPCLALAVFTTSASARKAQSTSARASR
eukprot:scaffold3542_cov113-Isochrysis_galbana.AAC.4